jgi:cytochrome b subunit of formate dehydrogenase
VSDANVVETCAACHPGANANFVEYDPHADYRDGDNYPILHGVWLYFVIMMSTVFGLFGLHTVLWFVRSKVEHMHNGKTSAHTHEKTAIRRFSKLNRVNHILVMLTFFGLTATGIPLVFNDQPWAGVIAGAFGGIEAAGLWHRVFAAMLIGNFIVHFIGLGRSFARRSCSWKEWLFGPNSLLPRWKDATDVFGMIRWFFGLGPRPRFDRWTYWEKFDYWAEVGGSMIIGGSGLLLWFPEIASHVFPGWAFNVAMIVHGYEALLAIGFIFTIHFFNAHLRPGVFPADTVIFTGNLPEEELKEQRPAEYERLVRTGRLEALREAAPDPERRPRIIAVAILLVSIGVVLVSLIIIGGLT